MLVLQRGVVYHHPFVFVFLHISYCVIFFPSFFSTSSLVVIVVGGSIFYIGTQDNVGGLSFIFSCFKVGFVRRQLGGDRQSSNSVKRSLGFFAIRR